VHRLALSARDTVTVALEQRFQLGTRWRDLGGRHMWRELKASYVPPGSGGAAEARVVMEYVAPFADSGGYEVVAIEQRGYEQPGLGLRLSHVWRSERDSTGGGWHGSHW
jgi:hypothetical protein